MSWLKRALRPVARSSSVRHARRAVGRVGAPGLNPEIELLHRRITDTDNGASQRLGRAEQRLGRAEERLDALETFGHVLVERMGSLDRHMPAVLNAIASTNGTARLLRRETDDVALRLGTEVARIDTALQELSGYISDDLWPLKAEAAGLGGLYETVEWLVTRVETVRAEMLHELRYGGGAIEGERHAVEARIVNPDALPADGTLPRLNLGCGHLPIEGYVNVDMRELPGVDVVAAVDELPFEPGGVDEIFSAHVLEHFPQAALQRQLLPYWHSLLAPGGTFRAVVPDIAAMIDQFREGQITFENLRMVAYGGQEYEGDFHHTAFTPESLAALLEQVGFDDVKVVDQGRVNGDCLEFEVVARRPG